MIFFWDILLWDFGIKEMNESKREDFWIFAVGWIVLILEHEYKLCKTDGSVIFLQNHEIPSLMVVEARTAGSLCQVTNQHIIQS